jgi:hypothetical protein
MRSFEGLISGYPLSNIIMQSGLVLRCQWMTEAGEFRVSQDTKRTAE